MKSLKQLDEKKRYRVISNLTKTKSKISNRWGSYRKQKQTILKNFKRKETRKKKIDLLLSKTRNKISNDWENYRDKKYSIIYKDKYKNLSLEVFKSHKYSNTFVEYLGIPKKEKLNLEELFSSKKLNNEIKNLFNSKRKKRILVDFIWYNEEKDSYIITSDSFTKEGFERVKNESLLELMIFKLSEISKDTDVTNYDLIDVSIRVYTD